MYTRLINHLLSENVSFFLFGPRGTGKTTWLKNHLFENQISHIYIDLLDYELFNRLTANPGHLIRYIPEPAPEWVVIDEVQLVPECLNEVHRLIESKKIKFILTGSSARKLRQKGINLLAGRAIRYELFPLTAIELQADFDLDFSLQFGHLPTVFSHESPKEYLAAYIQTYLKEEILQEGLVRNLGIFSRFLEIASFSQGALLNYSEIGRELGLDYKTVENYFSILEDLLIGYRVPPFMKKAKRRLMKTTKFYFFDTGIYHQIRPKGPLDRPEEIHGIALETLVFQELKAIIAYYKQDYQLYYWRTSHGKEVDFVLYGENGLIAIEVKHSDKIRSKDLNGLRQFKSDYEISKCYVFYRGKTEENWDGIRVIPVTSALKDLAAFF